MKLQQVLTAPLPVAIDRLASDLELTQQIQIRLKALRLLNKEDTADGLYGPITHAALLRFLKAFDLPTSEINPSTAKHLIECKEIPIPDWMEVDPAVVAEILHCSVEPVKAYLPAVLSALKERGLLGRLTLIAAIATIGVETGGFEPIPEWGDDEYFTANYENRTDLGNIYPGDGVRYKGRGFIQITGRINYQWYGKQLGVDLISQPDLALDPTIAARILALYFSERAVDLAAEQEAWRTVRRAVNGGLNGWDVFETLVKRAELRL